MIYRIQYPVTVYHEVRVDRPVDITKDDLLNSITRDDLANSEEVSDTWYLLKSAAQDPSDAYIVDEEGNDVAFFN